MNNMQIGKLGTVTTNMKLDGHYFCSFIYIDELNKEKSLEVVKQYLSYFYKADLIKMHIVCQSQELISEVQAIGRSTNNLLDNFPDALIFLTETPDGYHAHISSETNEHEIVNCNEFLELDSTEPYWIRLYRAFHDAIEFGNSWYEYGNVAYLYDICEVLKLREKGGDYKLSTYTSTLDLQCLDYIFQKKITSVFDIGCGAGSFYHLLNGYLQREVKYRGIDLSRNQILTAMANYGTEKFDLYDVQKLEIEDFNDYEFIHCFSVLNFLQTPEQEILLDKILNSNCSAIIEIGCTSDSKGFVPQKTFMKCSLLMPEHKVYSPINLPLVENILKILTPFSHKYKWEVIEKTSVFGPSLPTQFNEPVCVPSSYANILKQTGMSIVNKEFKQYIVKLMPKDFSPSDKKELEFSELDENVIKEKMLDIASNFHPKEIAFGCNQVK